MIRSISHWLKTAYTQTINSLAYFPVLISILMGALSFTLIRLRDSRVDSFLQKNFSALDSLESAGVRDLLGVVTAGSISITVFSFSMVMLVLSQGATTYSPKILDGLTKDKRPQRTIGVFVGTVVFCLPHLLLSSRDETISITAVVLAIALAIINMFVFIGFIHYVSQSIKPAQICRRIYRQAKGRPWEGLKLKNGAELSHKATPNEGNWQPIASRLSGYLQSLDLQELFELCEDKDIQLRLSRNIGDYILEGTPILEVLAPEKIDDTSEKELLSHLRFHNLEDISENPYYAYRQLTEVAVKAMSPGINDIGTAHIAQDFLIDLLHQYARKPWYKAVLNKNGKPRIELNPISLHQLFELCLDELRIYCMGDKYILLSLLQSCRTLLESNPENMELKEEVRSFCNKIMHKESDDLMQDREYMKVYYEHYLKQKLA